MKVSLFIKGYIWNSSPIFFCFFDERESNFVLYVTGDFRNVSWEVMHLMTLRRAKLGCREISVAFNSDERTECYVQLTWLNWTATDLK